MVEQEMPGIDPSIMVHRLNIDMKFKHVKHKSRTFNAEVDMLLKFDFIRESQYPKLIANVVLVKKANGN